MVSFLKNKTSINRLVLFPSPKKKRNGYKVFLLKIDRLSTALVLPKLKIVKMQRNQMMSNNLNTKGYKVLTLPLVSA